MAIYSIKYKDLSDDDKKIIIANRVYIKDNLEIKFEGYKQKKVELSIGVVRCVSIPVYDADCFKIETLGRLQLEVNNADDAFYTQHGLSYVHI